MMFKIEAYIREEKFEDVKAALDEIGVTVDAIQKAAYTGEIGDGKSSPMKSAPH